MSKRIQHSGSFDEDFDADFESMGSEGKLAELGPVPATIAAPSNPNEKLQLELDFKALKAVVRGNRRVLVERLLAIRLPSARKFEEELHIFRRPADSFIVTSGQLGEELAKLGLSLTQANLISLCRRLGCLSRDETKTDVMRLLRAISGVHEDFDSARGCFRPKAPHREFNKESASDFIKGHFRESRAWVAGSLGKAERKRKVTTPVHVLNQMIGACAMRNIDLRTCFDSESIQEEKFLQVCAKDLKMRYEREVLSMFYGAIKPGDRPLRVGELMGILYSTSTNRPSPDALFRQFVDKFEEEFSDIEASVDFYFQSRPEMDGFAFLRSTRRLLPSLEVGQVQTLFERLKGPSGYAISQPHFRLIFQPILDKKDLNMKIEEGKEQMRLSDVFKDFEEQDHSLSNQNELSGSYTDNIQPSTSDAFEQAELFLHKLSNYVLDLAEKQGKKLLDAFMMFNDKTNKYLNIKEFEEFVRFIFKEDVNVRDITLTFRIFKSTFSGKLSFAGLLKMVEFGKSICPLTIVVRTKFGERVMDYKNLFYEACVKADLAHKTGYISASALKRIFSDNKINITDADLAIIESEDGATHTESEALIDYKFFLNRIFRPRNLKYRYLSMIVAKMTRLFKYYKAQKVKRIGQDNLLKMLNEDSEAFLEPKTTKAHPVKEEKKIARRETMRFKPLKISDHLNRLIDFHRVSSPVNRGLVNHVTMKIIGQLIDQMIDRACVFGESLLFTRANQLKFATRSELKDVFSHSAFSSFEPTDCNLATLGLDPRTSRFLYADNQNYLRQFDFIRKTELPQVRLCEGEVLQALYHENSEQLFVLKRDLMLEVINLHATDQDKRRTLQITGSLPPRLPVSDCSFLSFSTPDQQYLVINSTAANNLVLLVEVHTLSIIKEFVVNYPSFGLSDTLVDSFAWIERNANRILAEVEALAEASGRPEDKTSVPREALLKILHNSLLLSEEQAEGIMPLFGDFPERIPHSSLAQLFTDLRGVADANGSKSNENEPGPIVSGLTRLRSALQNKNFSFPALLNLLQTPPTEAVNHATFSTLLETFAGPELDVEACTKMFYNTNKAPLEEQKPLTPDQLRRKFDEMCRIEAEDALTQRQPLRNIFTLCKHLKSQEIDLFAEFKRADRCSQLFLRRSEAIHLFQSFRLGLTPSDIDHLLKTNFVLEGDRVHYIDFFTGRNYLSKVEGLGQLYTPHPSSENLAKSQQESTNYSSSVVLRECIYVCDNNLVICTSQFPKSSIVWVFLDSSEPETIRCTPRLLAKLKGNPLLLPPKITYVYESGCLISGDRLLSSGDNSENSFVPKDISAYQAKSIRNPKTRADIFIFNLQKELLKTSLLPPDDSKRGDSIQRLLNNSAKSIVHQKKEAVQAVLFIDPARVIRKAHIGSVNDIVYLPEIQLLVSCSDDCSIKLWDPTSRSLQLLQFDTLSKLKPGYYRYVEDNLIKRDFVEARRIYTGNKQPKRLLVSPQNGSIGSEDFEFLSAVCLGDTTRVARRLITSFHCHFLQVDRCSIEIPVNCFHKPLPQSIRQQVASFAENRLVAQLKKYTDGVPDSVERVSSKVKLKHFLYKNTSNLIRSIYFDQFLGRSCHKGLKKLASYFAELNQQQALTLPRCYQILINSGLIREERLSLRELEDIFTRITFKLEDSEGGKPAVGIIAEVKEKVAQGELDLSELLSERETWTFGQLSAKFKSRFPAWKDIDIDHLVFALNPSHAESITNHSVFEFFDNQIIASKSRMYCRSVSLINTLSSTLSKDQKTELMHRMLKADSELTNLLSREEFIECFESLKSSKALARQIDSGFVSELFALLAKKFQGIKRLEVDSFIHLLFNNEDNVTMTKMNRIIGQIKNIFRYRLISLKSLFGETEPFLPSNEFIKRLKEVLSNQASYISEFGLESIRKFLSTRTPSGEQIIEYNLVRNYFDRLAAQFQFITPHLETRAVEFLKDFKSRRKDLVSDLRSVSDGGKVSACGLRSLLFLSDCDPDIIDYLLIKFTFQDLPPEELASQLGAFEEEQRFAKAKGVEKFSNLLDLRAAEDAKIEKAKKSIIEKVAKVIAEKELSATQNMLTSCRQFDLSKTGKILSAHFYNCVLYNLNGLDSQTLHTIEELFTIFDRELKKQNEIYIDYEEMLSFFEIRAKTDLADNPFLGPAVTKMMRLLAEAKINVLKALEVIDIAGSGSVLLEEFNELDSKWLFLDSKLPKHEKEALLSIILIDGRVSYHKIKELIGLSEKQLRFALDKQSFSNHLSSLVRSDNDSVTKIILIRSQLLTICEAYFNKNSSYVMSTKTFRDIIEDQFRGVLVKEQIDLLVSLAVQCSRAENSSIPNSLEEYVNMKYLVEGLEHYSINERYKEKLNSEQVQSFELENKLTKEQEMLSQIVISKIKAYLFEKELTIWQVFLSCNITIIEKSKVEKLDIFKLFTLINLPLTLTEKLSLIDYLAHESSPNGTTNGPIDLNTLLKTLENDSVKKKNSESRRVLVEKLIYQFFFEGYSIGRAFDMIDKDKAGFIGKHDFIVGLALLNLDFSAFEIGKLLEYFGIESFQKISRDEWKNRINRFLNDYNINIYKDFGLNILCRIKYLLEVKKSNLLEIFEEMDISKTGFADRSMLVACIKKFGLSAKEYELRMLLKLFLKDNLLTTKKKEVVVNEDKSLSLDLDDFKKKPKKSKKFDINSPSFQINYKDFVSKIYEEVESNSELFLRSARDVLKKIYAMLRIKGMSIFDLFINVDVSGTNNISQLEFSVGLSGLDIKIEQVDLRVVWSLFQKDRQNKVNFKSFFEAFMSNQIVDVIKIDNHLGELMKKFAFLIGKIGGAMKIMNFFDPANRGFVTFADFKKRIDSRHYEFREEEQEEIFQVLSDPNSFLEKQVIFEKEQTTKKGPDRCFNFKQLVSILSHFKSPEKIAFAFGKLNRFLELRGTGLGALIEPHLPAKKKGSKEPRILNVLELKKLIRKFKTGLLEEEIDLFVDSFENEMVSIDRVEARLREARAKAAQEAADRDATFSGIIGEIKTCLVREGVSLERLFAEADEEGRGTIAVGGLGRLFLSLGMTVGKETFRDIFDWLDTDRKGRISFRELRNFVDGGESAGGQREPSVAAAASLDWLKTKLREAAEAANTSLAKVVLGQKDLRPGEVVTVPKLEKALSVFGCLKRTEVQLLLADAASNGSASWLDVAAWGARNRIDSRAHFFNRALQVSAGTLSVLQALADKLRDCELDAPESFVYFLEGSRPSAGKKDFLTLLQGFGIPLGQEELLGAYRFFDPKNSGEVTREAWAEKLILLDQAGQEEEGRDSSAAPALSLKRQARQTFEKFLALLTEKRFNRNQMTAVFDRAMTGVMTRAGFLRVSAELGIKASHEELEVLFKFVDKSGEGAVDARFFVSKMLENAPEALLQSQRQKKALEVLAGLRSRLGPLVGRFMRELTRRERQLTNSSAKPRGQKTANAASFSDFYAVLGEFGLRPDESQKAALHQDFGLRFAPDWLDLESFYFAFGRGAPGPAADVSGWAGRILKSVAESLMARNGSLREFLRQIDPQGFAHVEPAKFGELLAGLELGLSSREAEVLAGLFAGPGGDVSLVRFSDAVWAAHFAGRPAAQLRLRPEKPAKAAAEIFFSYFRGTLKLSFEEFWTELDASGRGVVSLAEFEKAAAKRRFSFSREELGAVFAFFDLREDGVLDQFELAEAWKFPSFIELEANRSGLYALESGFVSSIVSRLRKAADSAGVAGLRPLFDAADETRRGRLDAAEFRLFLKRNFRLELPELALKHLMRAIGNEARVDFTELCDFIGRNALSGLRPPQASATTSDERGPGDKLIEKFRRGALRVFADQATPNGAEAPRMRAAATLHSLDHDFDGFLSVAEFGEFCEMMLGVKTPRAHLLRLAHAFAQEATNRIPVRLVLGFLFRGEQQAARPGRVVARPIKPPTTTVKKDIGIDAVTPQHIGPLLDALNPLPAAVRAAEAGRAALEALAEEMTRARGLALPAAKAALNIAERKAEEALKLLEASRALVSRAAEEKIRARARAELLDPRRVVAARPLPPPTTAVAPPAVPRFDASLLALETEVGSMGGSTGGPLTWRRGTLRGSGSSTAVAAALVRRPALDQRLADGGSLESHLLRTQETLLANPSLLLCAPRGVVSVAGAPGETDLYLVEERPSEKGWTDLADFVARNGGLLENSDLAASGALVPLFGHFWRFLAEAQAAIRSLGLFVARLRPIDILIKPATLELRLAGVTLAGRFNPAGAEAAVPPAILLGNEKGRGEGVDEIFFLLLTGKKMESPPGTLVSEGPFGPALRARLALELGEADRLDSTQKGLATSDRMESIRAGLGRAVAVGSFGGLLPTAAADAGRLLDAVSLLLDAGGPDRLLLNAFRLAYPSPAEVTSLAGLLRPRVGLLHYSLVPLANSLTIQSLSSPSEVSESAVESLLVKLAQWTTSASELRTFRGREWDNLALLRHIFEWKVFDKALLILGTSDVGRRRRAVFRPLLTAAVEALLVCCESPHAGLAPVVDGVLRLFTKMSLGESLWLLSSRLEDLVNWSRRSDAPPTSPPAATADPSEHEIWRLFAAGPGRSGRFLREVQFDSYLSDLGTESLRRLLGPAFSGLSSAPQFAARMAASNRRSSSTLTDELNAPPNVEYYRLLEPLRRARAQLMAGSSGGLKAAVELTEAVAASCRPQKLRALLDSKLAFACEPALASPDPSLADAALRAFEALTRPLSDPAVTALRPPRSFDIALSASTSAGSVTLAAVPERKQGVAATSISSGVDRGAFALVNRASLQAAVGEAVPEICRLLASALTTPAAALRLARCLGSSLPQQRKARMLELARRLVAASAVHRRTVLHPAAGLVRAIGGLLPSVTTAARAREAGVLSPHARGIFEAIFSHKEDYALRKIRTDGFAVALLKEQNMVVPPDLCIDSLVSALDDLVAEVEVKSVQEVGEIEGNLIDPTANPDNLIDPSQPMDSSLYADQIAARLEPLLLDLARLCERRARDSSSPTPPSAWPVLEALFFRFAPQARLLASPARVCELCANFAGFLSEISSSWSNPETLRQPLAWLFTAASSAYAEAPQSKFAANRLVTASARIFWAAIRLLEAAGPLSDSDEARRLVSAAVATSRRQFEFLSSVLEAKTEDLNAVGSYALECHARTALISLMANRIDLASHLAHSEFPSFVVADLSCDTRTFDAGFVKVGIDFLPFAELPPFRAEGLLALRALLSSPSDSLLFQKTMEAVLLHNILGREFTIAAATKGPQRIIALGFLEELYALKDDRVAFEVEKSGLEPSLSPLAAENPNLLKQFPTLFARLRHLGYIR